MHRSALMLIEYMERCHVGCGWPASTLVLVHVWIWMCNYLLYNTPWLEITHFFVIQLQCQWCTVVRWRILACYSNTHQRRCHTALRRCWLNSYIAYLLWNVIVLISCWLWTNRGYVAMHWCMFEFECVITCCMIHDGNNTITHLHVCYSTSIPMTYGSVLIHIRMLFIHTTTAMAYGSALMLIEYIIYCTYIIKRCRVGFERAACTLICTGVCLYFHMSNGSALITLLQLHAHLLFKYIIDWIYGTVSCWFWTNSMYVGIGACLNLNVQLPGIRCTIANTIAIAHSPAL